jgi:hypothetical protein
VALDGRTTGISGAIRSGNQMLDVSALPQGAYMLLENTTNRSTYRFTKQ